MRTDREGSSREAAEPEALDEKTGVVGLFRLISAFQFVASQGTMCVCKGGRAAVARDSRSSV
jgi:hypothetical protein